VVFLHDDDDVLHVFQIAVGKGAGHQETGNGWQEK
jgi:hypothetical protein